MLKPCLSCGLPSDQSRCPEHRPKDTRDHRARGYDAAWDRLSQRARRLQRFCSDCGATSDLQCDHTPEAWQRKAEGKPIRLRDVDVCCGKCNRRRGSARPGTTRVAPQTPAPAPDGKARRRLLFPFGAYPQIE